MQTTERVIEIKAKIVKLREKYGRLRNLCGAQRISKETIAEYARELQKLESRLR